jgi:hypothetical protein
VGDGRRDRWGSGNRRVGELRFRDGSRRWRERANAPSEVGNLELQPDDRLPQRLDRLRSKERDDAEDRSDEADNQDHQDEQAYHGWAEATRRRFRGQ